MSSVKRGLIWCSEKTGMSPRWVFWSLFSVIVIILFSVLFTYPLIWRLKLLDVENKELDARLQELDLLQVLDAKLDRKMTTTYPELEKIPVDALEEELLLELPSRFEELAASAGVTLISIDSKSVDDGAYVAINSVFQGDMQQLYKLLKTFGSVRYISRLESLSVLALPDAEQMELKFTVPIK